MWNIGLSYKNGPFFVGATYMALQGDGFDDFVTRPAYDGDQWGVAFGYNSGPFAVTLAYEDGDVNTLNFGDSQNVYLTGQYTFGPHIIRAAYGYTTADDGRINILSDGDVHPFRWRCGYPHSTRRRQLGAGLPVLLQQAHPGLG